LLHSSHHDLTKSAAAASAPPPNEVSGEIYLFFASGIPITSTTCCFHDWFFLLWIEESHVALKFWLFCD
jgi:hypothetical protein